MLDKLNQTEKESVWQIAIGVAVFFFSMVLSQLYVEGDQLGYHRAYSLIEGLGLTDGFFIYEHNVSGAEYTHFLLSLLGSNLGIDKNMLMSLFNAILAVLSLRLLEKWGADFRVSCFIVLTNFYLFVLYFAAERLKIGFIFLVLSLLYCNRPLNSYLLSFLSIWSHFSMSFVYASVLLANIYDQLRSGLKIRSKSFYLSILMLLPPLLLFLYESKTILWKLSTYIERNLDLSVATFIPLGLVMAFTGIYVKDIRKSFVVFAPFLVGVALLGGSRLNMLAYFVFLYFGLKVNAGLNAGILLTAVYFFYKSIGFVANILDHGHGFS